MAPKRLVELAVVEKKLVVVALVVVEFPVIRRLLARVTAPLVSMAKAATDEVA